MKTKQLNLFLADFPNFFGDTAFITRSESKVALTRACRAYLEASELIRSRPANQPCLFSFSNSNNGSESRFYSNVAAIISSLESPTRIPLLEDFTVFTGPVFYDQFKSQNFLPAFFKTQ